MNRVWFTLVAYCLNITVQEYSLGFLVLCINIDILCISACSEFTVSVNQQQSSLTLTCFFGCTHYSNVYLLLLPFNGLKASQCLFYLNIIKLNKLYVFEATQDIMFVLLLERYFISQRLMVDKILSTNLSCTRCIEMIFCTEYCPLLFCGLLSNSILNVISLNS